MVAPPSPSKNKSIAYVTIIRQKMMGDKYLLLLASFATLILTKVMIFTSSSVENKASSTTINNNPGYPIVVIDAGSSGSRAHIFYPSSEPQQQEQLGIEPRHDSFKTKPGLSSYASKPTEAGPSLGPLMDFLREKITEDGDMRRHTKILLKATAGMRLLPEEEQTSVMASVREYLQQQEFEFVTAEVIDGAEEGLLGWTAVNFLKQKQEESSRGKKKKNDDELWSVIEMGGASVQVTVPLSTSTSSLLRSSSSSKISNMVPKELQRPYQLSKDNKGMVYTHSFLGLGMESARARINTILTDIKAEHDPCLNTGYDGEGYENPSQGVPTAKPSSNGPQCRELIRKVLFVPQSDDEKKPCEHKQGCLFNGLPSFPKPITKLWGFENIFYTPSAMGIPANMSLKELLEMGERVCEMDWTTVESQYPKDNQPTDINEKWCFGSMYLYSFFVDGLGLDPNMEMTASNDVDGNGIDWSLGAALMSQSQ